MPIHIKERQSDYTDYIVIHNSLVPTIDLSPEALGILTYFLTKAKDWNPSIEDLKQFQIGAFKADRVFKELQKSHCLYPEPRRKKGQYQPTLWHVSNVPLTDEKFKAMIKAAASDHLVDAQPGEAVEGTNDATEVEATLQLDDSVGAPIESLSEDEGKDVEEKVVAEIKDEPVVDYSMIDIGNPAETLPESPPEDERKHVQEEVTEIKNDPPEHETAAPPEDFIEPPLDSFPRDEGNQSPVSNEQPSDEESKAPINEADSDPSPATQREEAAKNKNDPVEDEATVQPDDSAEKLPASPPEDERKHVQVKVVTEIKDESVEFDTTSDDKLEAPTKETDPNSLPTIKHEAVVESRYATVERRTTIQQRGPTTKAKRKKKKQHKGNKKKGRKGK